MDKLLRKKSIFSFFITLTFICFANKTVAQSAFVKVITPDQLSLQYAGSIGYFSVGAGYHLFKEKTTLSFHYGYVPESKGGELNILAIKYQYRPFNINIKDVVVIQPFNPVFFASYTLGKNFDYEFTKPRYQKGYYFWSSALRLHLGASSEVKIMGDPKGKIKSVSLFAEANTNDLYAISWFENRTSTPFYKMFKLGYGVRMNF